MPQQAHVTSVEAIDSFRANLIIYLSKARPTLEELTAEVVRTRVWLESDRRAYWEAQTRMRGKELEEAQQALFSARLGMLRKETAAEQMAVHRAKRALDEAVDKLRVVRRWNREFDGRVQPLVKQMEKLHTVLTNEMVKAVAFLVAAINTLAAYAEVHQVPSGAEAAAPRQPAAAGEAAPRVPEKAPEAGG